MATPLMTQYGEVKAAHRDALVFFRLGDFYELFYEDAKTAARILGITLTARAKEGAEIPMAGVPHHAATGYIRKLLARGFKVAICDQVEDPKAAKGIVRREVTRVITPGTALEDNFLEANRENLLVAVAPAAAGDRFGVAWADLSTGRFEAADLDPRDLATELARKRPAELLLPDALRGGPAPGWLSEILPLAEGRVTHRPDWIFERDAGRRALLDHFRTKTLAGFGAERLAGGLGAAAAVLDYLKETQKTPLAHVTALVAYEPSESLQIDPGALSGLELLETASRAVEGSVLAFLDRTRTGMGGRTLRRWLTHPLKEKRAIEKRLDQVGSLAADHALREELVEAIAGLADLERIGARVATRRVNPRELSALRAACRKIPAIRGALSRAPGLGDLAGRLDPLGEAGRILADLLADDPPFEITEGGIFREGVSPELDDLRSVLADGKGWIARFQADEAKRTGINSLKVGYNRVFGYYIEITNVHQGKVPADYTRKQTMKGAERYITPALKEKEEKVLSADARAKAWEHERFLALREELAPFVERILATGRALAEIDATASLSLVAAEQGFTRPRIVEEPVLSARNLRHPVLAARSGIPFVPNDITIDGKTRLLVITGPNMAGKSTYIRQAGILVVLAQMGSFVPAESATVGIADRLFARVGSADDITRDMSTFMVEMSEAARILHTATDRSLVVLDEIGRGTSTYDGVSLAWAIAERLAGSVRARSLFATHYHELAALADESPAVANLNVLVREEKGEVAFLHKVVPGATDRSYGIHVAKLAGVPLAVLARAKEVLAGLEKRSDGAALKKPEPAPADPDDPVREALRELEIDAMTPLAALNLLKELKEAASDGMPVKEPRPKARRKSGQAGGPTLFS